MKTYYLVFIFFLITGCSAKTINKDLALALELAGDNRGELEKVLQYYQSDPNDKLKYEAACFLIKNMIGHWYYEGEHLDNYMTFYHAISKTHDIGFVMDSLENLWGKFSLQKLNLKYDIEKIDSAYLCHNIEWSFKVWENQPWGRNITFENFCKYILPYRLGHEKLTYWKEDFYHKYSHFLTDTPGYAEIEDPLIAATIIRDSVCDYPIRFTQYAPPGIPDIDPFTSEYLSGTCENYTSFSVFVCRALGIPCGIDYIPMKGGENYGHSWAFYLDKEGVTHMQEFPYGIETLLYGAAERAGRKLKVFRKSFAVNTDILNRIHQKTLDIPSLFVHPFFEDVTSIYADCMVEEILISKEVASVKKKDIPYLCLPVRMGWVPVEVGEIERGKVKFNHIQKGEIVRIATYENGELVFKSPPFMIDCVTGDIHVFKSDGELEDVILFSKTNLGNDKLFQERMIGGVFEGSNTADFRDKDTLHIITEKPYRLLHEVYPESNKKYRFVRYWGPEDAYCNVSEISFYQYREDSIPMTGKMIGTPDAWQDNPTHDFTKALDGKTDTSFDYKEPYGGWAGWDLGVPMQINKIIYTPRNYDNYIRPGDIYELFSYDGEWNSLGRVTSRSDSLTFSEVPVNTLLYLKNHSRGIDERIFIYKENKQIW